MYYFYILKCKDGSLYCGSTKNLENREVVHNSGKGSKYVRSRGGGKMIYSEPYKTKSSALRREVEVKKYSRQEKINLLKSTMQNQTILISGGATGIGAATALEFLAAGWQVAVFSNVPKHNQAFLKLATSQGLASRLLVLAGDITKEQELKKIVAAVKKKFKTIDVLYNNAGLGYFSEADKLDVKKFDQMMEVNIIGMADLVKLVLPFMKKQKSGQIINMASVAGLAGHAVSEFYAASKSAVIRYSEGLRQELEKSGIKVAVLCPDMVSTNFWTKREYDRRKQTKWHGKDPVRLSPGDIAKIVKFICSQDQHCEIQEVIVRAI